MRATLAAVVVGLLGAGLARADSALPVPLVVNVRDVGAQGNGTTNDTAAIQRANDLVSRLGGGEVYFPPGTYIAGGLAQDSDVQFVGTSGAVLKHPNGVNPQSIIKSRMSGTTGSIASGSRTLIVDSTYRIRPGALVAVRGAGGPSADQTTTVAQPIDASSTSIPVASTAGFASSGILQVDNEAVYYGSVTPNGFNDVLHGVWGTQVVAHAQGTPISQVTYLYASIVSASGNVVTLDRDARFGVTSAAVTVGAVNISTRDLTLDGNKPTSGVYTSITVPVEYLLANGATISGNTIRNGIHGGVRLDLGTTNVVVENNTFTDNGRPFERLGSAIWMFRGSSGNTIRGNTITGYNFWGITMDDRTETPSEYDAPSNNNLVENNTVDYPAFNYSVGIFVTGCSDNTVRNNAVGNVQTGIGVDASIQGPHPLDAERNAVSANTLTGNRIGIHVSGSYNTFAGNQITSATTPVVDVGTQNTFSS